MSRPDEDIEGCAAAHRRLRGFAVGLSDEAVARSSLLEGWTVGHVLTHLARNAEAMCRRITAAQLGEMVDQYEGGTEGRARQIAEGARREARVVIEDLQSWCTELDDLFASLSTEAWDRPVRTVGGADHPVALLPFRRWREVEIHMVDLDCGYGPTDWPGVLVERMVPRLLDGVRARTDDRLLMAWLLGRADAPDLQPWG